MSGNVIARRLFQVACVVCPAFGTAKPWRIKERLIWRWNASFSLFDGEIDDLETRLPGCGFRPIMARLTMTDTFLPAMKDEDMIQNSVLSLKAKQDVVI